MSALLLKYLAYAASVAALLVLLSILIYFLKTPSHDKNWALGEGKTASVQINQDNVTIYNFRDADWATIDTNLLKKDDSLFKEFSFKLSDIQSLSTVVSHFAPLSEIAHILILFELKNKTTFGLSVEARKEQGESYSLSGGLSAKFELIYVLSSYRDVVGIRLNRNEEVYNYPIKASPEEVQSLFKVVAERTNKINKKPEFYHLFLKNCTTEIVKLVNQIADKNFPRLTQSFMPGDAGKALFKMDLIDSDESDFKAIQKASLLNK